MSILISLTEMKVLGCILCEPGEEEKSDEVKSRSEGDPQKRRSVLHTLRGSNSNAES